MSKAELPAGAERVDARVLQDTSKVMGLVRRVQQGQRIVLEAPFLGDLVAVVPVADLDRLADAPDNRAP